MRTRYCLGNAHTRKNRGLEGMERKVLESYEISLFHSSDSNGKRRLKKYSEDHAVRFNK